jgi:alkylation response protein AidB-like acyl-CoA dehydrogenase
MCGAGLGIQLLFIPEEFEGMGAGAFDIYRICEELARVDLGVATGIFATFLGSDPIVYGGTYEQRKKWMRRIGQEGLLMAYGATEPEAGSDLGALRTVAEPVLEDGKVKGYKITGNSSGSATAALPIFTLFLPRRRVDPAGSSLKRTRRDSAMAIRRISMASVPAIRRGFLWMASMSTQTACSEIRKGRDSFRRSWCSDIRA